MLPHQCPHPYHQKHARRRVERNSLFAVVLLLVLSFVAGRVSLKSVDEYQLENANLAISIDELKLENKTLLKQQDFIQNSQKIDLQAKQESRRSLTKLHDELSEIKEQLAFYQRVVAPETLVKGLYVDSFEIKALHTKGDYRYQLILAQGGTQKSSLKGRYSMVVSGELAGKALQLSLNELLVSSKKLTKYSFRYYQLLSAELRLPSGFVPKRVKLTAKPSKKGGLVVVLDQSWVDVVKGQ